MTPEFGAASQLEKIDMLDFADFVAINKFERKGAHGRPARCRPSSTSATAKPGAQKPESDAGLRHHRPRRFNDDGVTALYQAQACWRSALLAGATGHVAVMRRGPPKPLPTWRGAPTATPRNHSPIVPPRRVRYLAEIAETVRGYKQPSPRSGASWPARCSSCAKPSAGHARCPAPGSARRRTAVERARRSAPKREARRCRVGPPPARRIGRRMQSRPTRATSRS